MRRVSGWVIAGVVCLIIITLSLTGILTFGNSGTTNPPTSSSVARVAEDVSNVLTYHMPLI